MFTLYGKSRKGKPLIKNIREDPEYYEEIYPNVWLMDDHKWACYIWESLYSRKVKLPSTLVHIDYHWDAISDFSDDYALSLIENPSLVELKELIKNDQFIRKDSYMAPAIIKKQINEIYFYCRQTDTEIGFYQPFLDEHKAKQIFTDDINELSEQINDTEMLLDIDIDIFNKTRQWSEGDLWEEKEIISFLDSCENLIKNAKVITIAMSHNYSGTPEDTKYLTELTVSKILNII